MVEHGAATEEEIAAVDKEIKTITDNAVKFATEAAMPDARELYTNVLMTPSFIRGRSIVEHN
jgi:TPP-dependent pyruvate/acetoin dehydrogenase alpha subunit